jgi:nicotinate-nucleotide adenylyltransferase
MAREVVALFGGSFNPPHVGHVLAASYVLSVGWVDRVLVVPVFEHALGKSLVGFEHRTEMARQAFGWLPRVEVSTIEASLGAPSRTLRTIVALEEQHPEWALRLLVGSDITHEIEKWHAFDQIESKAPPLYLQRAGSPVAKAGPGVLPEVSSTSVRGLLASARRDRPPPPELGALVPRAVLDYIWREGLFTAP